MKKKIVILRKVFGSIDKREFRLRSEPMEMVETDKSFVGCGYIISKDKIMRIDTIFHENPSCVKYFTYALDGNEQLAINKLKSHIIEKVEFYKKDFDLLYANLKNPTVL